MASAAYPLTIPDVNTIRALRTIAEIWKGYSLGKPLQNKHRVKIAKAIIDECLKFEPNRTLNRQDFEMLADSIVRIFHTEVASAYFIPSARSCPARGKLVSAYSNKRTLLSSEGVIRRREKKGSKRTRSESPNPSFVTESIEYLQQNDDTDFTNILCKWSETHNYRMNELYSNVSTYDYITKYPALQGKSGIELVRFDVNILYPSLVNIESWIPLYPKVVRRARMLKDRTAGQIVEEIDATSDERFKAQLALILIPYILPHCGKRSECQGGNASKNEIQERFMREYKSLADLKNDTENSDLRIKWIREKGAISYAEFSIAGYIFNCNDLMEAVNILFMYTMALNVTYPKIISHVWQFIQLAIFQVHLPDTKAPIIETIINDLSKEL